MSLLSRERSHKLHEVSLDDHPRGQIKVGGLVTSLRIVLTKNTSREMVFATIEDDTGSLEAVVFPKVFNATRRCWVKDQIVLIDGKVEVREESLSLIVDNASLLSGDEAADKKEKSKELVDFEIKIPAQISSQKLVELNKTLKQNQGKNKLALVFIDNLGRKRRMTLPFGVNYTQELAEEIKDLLEA